MKFPRSYPWEDAVVARVRFNGLDAVEVHRPQSPTSGSPGRREMPADDATPEIFALIATADTAADTAVELGNGVTV
jgi:hypothetical protein